MTEPSHGASVEITQGGSVRAAPGDTVRLSASVLDGQGQPVPGAVVRWTSADAAVAQVDASGLVVAVAAGSTTMTATAASGASAVVVVTVRSSRKLDDRAVLTVLYEATDGPNWIENEGWLTDAPLGDWHGVTTDGSGRVGRLDLHENNLTGEIPPELGDLASLKRLDLHNNNKLTGDIPVELGDLASLEWLWLFDNELTGNIPPELGNLANLEILDLGWNELTGGIPAALANLASLEWLGLEYNDLTGDIPVELGNLASLRGLSLYRNNLTGEIPVELGNLASLVDLNLSHNGLIGNIPPELGNLDRLRALHLEDNDLTGDIPAELGNPANLRTLRLDNNKLTGDIPAELGNTSLMFLQLYDNELTGEVPSELGNLANLRTLRLDDNKLTGVIPAELGNLANLERMHWDDNAGLCAPGTRQFIHFVSWLEKKFGPFCHEADAAVLGILFTSTKGRSSWNSHDGWFGYDGPLSDWQGITTDDSGRVERINLSDNNLAGELPAELGDLASLKELDLSDNDLTGALPRSLVLLKELRDLRVNGNSELGGRLALGMTDLSLRTLRYDGTSLCAPVEPSFRHWLQSIAQHTGNGVECPPLTDRDVLETLYYSVGGPNWEAKGKWLTELPLEDWYGVLTNGSGRVERINLHNNNLTGEIPAELGNLASLERLALAHNAGMSGILPIALTSLDPSEFMLGNTELCAPWEDAFHSWLRSIPIRRVAMCVERAGGEATTAAYIVQAVQSFAFPVPLVAGRPGLLRVFTSIPQADGARAPSARATFYQRDGSERTIEAPSGNGALTAELQEGNLEASANVEVPVDVLRPGVEMVVEVDPVGVLDPVLGVPGRIPATGRTVLEVYELPPFDVTVVPFLWELDPDTSILAVTRGMTPENPLFEATRTLLPVGAMSVTVHEPVWTSSRSAYHLLSETEAIRTMENGGGYWMGTLPNPTGRDGLANIPGRSQISSPNPVTVARGFGHNFHLGYAPCGGVLWEDSSYPDRGGLIGAWGWDRRSESLVSPKRPDLMGYCDSPWVSDYSFANAFRWRMHDEEGIGAFAGPRTRVLLLWGGTDADGKLFLNPAFVVGDVRASLPGGAGEWRLVGEAGDGRALFDRAFKMSAAADGDGRASFVFALPAEAGWENELERIVLTGPGGTAEMDTESSSAMALLLDPGTGRVRGILRDWPGLGTVQADAGGAGARTLKVQVSRGVPAADAWRL